MKSIKIKSIQIVNFKGINNLKIDFNDTTNILGDNGTGKTSIFDAFTWVLFGKDSHDRTQFDIKNTKDKNKNRQDHEVTVFLDINGFETTLKRIFKEKHTKKRGSETTEFVGNETLNYWNDVPMTQTEYTKKVSEILDEKLFKMISSPTYFNNIKWEERRNILNTLITSFSDEDVAKGNPAFEKIVAELKQGKTIEQYEAQDRKSVV
jgi:predicted ATP-dependent endonuclease of OLD family